MRMESYTLTMGHEQQRNRQSRERRNASERRRMPDSTGGAETAHSAGGAERLQKYLAHAGIASRRHAEELILAGQISVNGQVVRELGAKVNPATDEVRARGRLVRPAAEHVY